MEEINHINIHNVFTAAATVTQPIYTGGKIAAYYKLCQLSEELNHSELDTKKQDIMMETDKAYWMVVSLVKKSQVAQEYLDLVKLLLYNVNKMLEHGVATLSDQLTVQVKENEANVQLQKVDDGIVLSKMVLAKICGLPLDTDIITEDELERKSDQPYFELRLDSLNMENIFANRDEIKSLSIAT